MGNKAVIAFSKNYESVGIYLHWDGGPESVLAFLAAAKQLGVRDPLADNYGVARLTQIIGNYFGGTNLVGVDHIKNLDTDNGDNGVYYVGPGFTIAGRSDAGPKTVAELSKDDGASYESNLKAILEANASAFARG